MTTSVAIVTRNRDKSLKRCLKSLTNQKVKPDEVLVIDNASADFTRKVALSFVGLIPIRYIYEPNIGIPYARNMALSKAKSDILIFTDDDCEVFTNWIENILIAHKKYPYIVAIQGWSISVPQQDTISIISQYNTEKGLIANIIQNHQKPTQDHLNLLERDFKILILDSKNVSLKLKIIKRLNLRFNNSLVNAEDDFWFGKQILSKGQSIIFCPNIKVYHWERSNIKKFIIQRFIAAKGIAHVHREWPKRYFPKRERYWRIKRFMNFFTYSIKNGYTKKILHLTLYFILEKTIFLLGYYLALLKYSKLTKNPSANQKKIAP